MFELAKPVVAGLPICLILDRDGVMGLLTIDDGAHMCLPPSQEGRSKPIKKRHAPPDLECCLRSSKYLRKSIDMDGDRYMKL